jgi:hypothetical protein
VLHPDVGPAEEAGPDECGGGPGGWSMEINAYPQHCFLDILSLTLFSM